MFRMLQKLCGARISRPPRESNDRERSRESKAASVASKWEYAMTPDASLVNLAKVIASRHFLSPFLVCAVIEQESSWDTWAIRYEPKFFTKYVAPLYTNNKISATEAYGRGFSWGLMQLMGECARECGFAEPFLSSLCDPATGIEWGCQHLRKKLDAADGELNRGLLAWNGGGNKNYATEVFARMQKYTSPEAT